MSFIELNPMQYSTLPPEVNSANIYDGPGPDSVYAAAEGWEKLAGEIRLMPEQVQGMRTELQESYSGESAEMVTEFFEDYSSLLNTAAEYMTQDVTFTYDFADAFAAARRDMVDPELIKQNRRILRALQTTNVDGENAHLISDVENEYMEFWAKNSQQMETYAAKAQQAFRALQELPDVQITCECPAEWEGPELYIDPHILTHLKESGYANLFALFTPEQHA